MQAEARIAPSILSADLLRLGDELASVGTADYIHFDVMDGDFVPQLSFGHPLLKAVKRATSLPVDVHLMVSNPDAVVGSYLDAGADIVSFHLEAATHAHRIVSQIHEAGRLAAVAINPGTAVGALDAIVEDVDMVLVMTVDPGFGGQHFIQGSVAKLRALRSLCERHGVSPLIEVDGGINAQTAPAVAAAGADVLVAGSAVFGAQDRAAAIAQLREAALSGQSRRA